MLGPDQRASCYVLTVARVPVENRVDVYTDVVYVGYNSSSKISIDTSNYDFEYYAFVHQLPEGHFENFTYEPHFEVLFKHKLIPRYFLHDINELICLQ